MDEFFFIKLGKDDIYTESFVFTKFQQETQTESGCYKIWYIYLLLSIEILDDNLTHF